MNTETLTQVKSLAGTTWSFNSSQLGNLIFVFGTGCEATLTAPNGATHTFVWAESEDGSGQFWMNESSSTTNDKYLYLLSGKTDGKSGSGIVVCSAPNQHTAPVVSITLTKTS